MSIIVREIPEKKVIEISSKKVISLLEYKDEIRSRIFEIQQVNSEFERGIVFEKIARTFNDLDKILTENFE